ncbi:MAG: hypothetical protein R3C26_06420 [Calditrichia bacterium]
MKLTARSGTVISSTDVLRRCIQKIETAISESKDLDELQNIHNFQKAISLLNNNLHTTVNASSRIVTLVKSLKNFRVWMNRNTRLPTFTTG